MEGAPKTQAYLALSMYCGKATEQLYYLKLAEKENKELLFSIVPPSLFYTMRASIEYFCGHDSLNITANNGDATVSDSKKEEARNYFTRAAEDYLRAANGYNADMMHEMGIDTSAVKGTNAVEFKSGNSNYNAVSVVDLDQVKAKLLRKAITCYVAINDQDNAKKVSESLQALTGKSDYSSDSVCEPFVDDAPEETQK
jgi:hypothetical protein